MSIFDDVFDHAMDSILGRLSDEPVAAALTFAASGATLDLRVVFNEQVGFVDDQRRAVFTLDADDLTTGPIRRGDFFVLQGETDRWYAIDIRDDKAGAIEIRCDGYLERL